MEKFDLTALLIPSLPGSVPWAKGTAEIMSVSSMWEGVVGCRSITKTVFDSAGLQLRESRAHILKDMQIRYCKLQLFLSHLI